MRTLLVDIGNSRVKWRVIDVVRGFDESDPSGFSSVFPEPVLTGLDKAGPAEVALISNVAGREFLAVVEQTIESTFGDIVVRHLHASAQESGVRNGYREPSRLGSDRWAQLIGARALFPARQVVLVSLGTATTIDLLLADGLFAGGVILPGLELMRRALARETADLPLAQGVYAELANNTDDAILSGILHAQAGAIERVVRLVPDRDENGTATLIVLSGGHATTIAPHLPFSVSIIDNLVLRGLAVVARTIHP